MGRSKRVYNLIMDLWPLYKVGLWTGNQPGMGALLKPVFSSKIHQVTIIPVNEPIQTGEQTALPYTLLTQLVEQASARFIMTECVCRSHENCQSYPVSLGCLFLGDGAAKIHPSLGRLASIEEAKVHVRQGMQMGLLPLIAHTVVDALALGIPYNRMLAVCFCCECCCAVQRGMHQGPPTLLRAVQPLPGLSVFVGDECVNCGECVEVCPTRAISLDHTRAMISKDCKVCGLCVNACPNGAISVIMDDEDNIMARFRARIKQYADIEVNGKH